MTASTEPRETCFVCWKPRATCICDLVRRIDNRTGIYVLQHPRERAHPIGTARFVELGLRKSEVVLALTRERDFRASIAVPPGTGLLYPRADARDLEDLPIAERPDHLVVLDGTWPHARTLYRQNAWLHALPHFRLSPSAPSRYRIRKEPSPDYVSTLESVLLALHILEPETRGLADLMAAFERMIDTQIRYTERALATGAGRRHKRTRRSPRFRGIPRWLGDEYGKLVGVYAEALPAASDEMPGPRELLQLSAVRFATGETHECMVMPRTGLPSTEELAGLGLSPADFEGAVSPDSLAADFERFVADGEVLVAWNGVTPNLMHDATGLKHRVRLLSVIVRGLRASDPAPFAGIGASPSLDELVALTRGDTALTPLALRGRAATRLANLHAMAAWTHERARVAQAEDAPATC